MVWSQAGEEEAAKVTVKAPCCWAAGVQVTTPETVSSARPSGQPDWQEYLTGSPSTFIACSVKVRGCKARPWTAICEIQRGAWAILVTVKCTTADAARPKLSTTSKVTSYSPFCV